MAPKRATRSNTTPETTNTTSVTNAQLQAMIDQGITAALAVCDADRNTNGDDSHNSGMSVRRTKQTAREFGHDAAYGSLRTPQGTLRTNNNNNRTRGRTLAGIILQGLVKRNNMGDLNPYAQNATITTTVHVLPDATSAINSAIWPMTAGALQLLIMLTIRGVLGWVRSLLAMSVEFKDISRGNVQS
ncbi:hypothetical protein Tco_1390257 [Tanacetum coccineum]